MATPQTTITDTGTSRYSRSRFHPRSFRENVTSIDVEVTRKPVEAVTSTPVDLPAEHLVDEQGELPDRRLTQSELYPVRQAFSREHITALRLLSLMTGRSQRAMQSIANQDVLAADTEIQKLQVLLPELFCCRTLGDGFGTIVNALMSSFEGLGGDTPTATQVRAISKILAVLRNKPFLSADEADEEVGSLEAVGLNPYPAELLDFLSSE